MKKISTALCALAAVAAVSSPSFAADMRLPTKAPPMPPPPIFTWTGFYIGVNGGGAFGSGHDVDVVETVNGTIFSAGTWPGFGNFGSLEPTGGFGGGQIGYNFQAPGSNWVWGFEADIQGASIKDDATATLSYIAPPATITVDSANKVTWFGTARGRLGIAFDRVLVYATGGVAFGESKFSLSMAETFAGNTALVEDKDTRVGWVAGGGVEWAFAPNWSLKGEYQYIDLGKRTVTAPEFTAAGLPTTFAISTEARTDFHTGRIGINYRF
jgi:outer membrane immunogenic protein